MTKSAISKAAAAMGRKGGKVKCRKGFACPHVQRRAQKARRIKREEKNDGN